jgi:D-glycero-alpha-D-manno-heptose-7-phosphate kinase
MAREAGAIGAKVSGAGGGGFMMFVVPTERRYRLITALSEQGAAAYPVKFSERGSESWTLRTHR